jgi:hypothetical protein
MRIRTTTLRAMVAAVVVAGMVLATALGLVPVALADGGNATHYYLSLGDSYADSAQPNGDFDHGYAEQLHEILARSDPKLKLVKLGCSGESTVSMRFGDPSTAEDVAPDCGTPSFYRHRYPHKTQLAEAVSFLHAHEDRVRLVTIDIGINDVAGPGGPGAVAENLPAILAELRAAGGRRS